MNTQPYTFGKKLTYIYVSSERSLLKLLCSLRSALSGRRSSEFAKIIILSIASHMIKEFQKLDSNSDAHVQL